MASQRDTDLVLHILLVVVAALYAPLQIELRDTAWGGFLYATLVLGGVVILFVYALTLGELVVKWLSHAARPRPGALGSPTVIGRTGGRAESMKFLGVLMAIALTVVVAVVLMPVFATDLSSWESFLAGAAAGGHVAGVALVIFLGLVEPRGQGDDDDDDSRRDPRPHWLIRTEQWLYRVLLLCVMLVMLTLTQTYAFPIWPSFAVVGMAAGPMSLT